jgi:hypothetical protein
MPNATIETMANNYDLPLGNSDRDVLYRRFGWLSPARGIRIFDGVYPNEFHKRFLIKP